MISLNLNDSCYGVTDESYTTAFCSLGKNHMQMTQKFYILLTDPLSLSTHKVIWTFFLRTGQSESFQGCWRYW